MIAALLFSTAAVAAPAGPGSAEVLIGEARAPLALLIGAPRAGAAWTSKEDVRALILERIEADTALYPVHLEEKLLIDCRGAIGCIVDRLPAETSRWMLLVALVDRAEGARLDVTLVDVPRALQVKRESSGDDAEVAIAQQAVLARRATSPRADVAELATSVREMFEAQLRPLLEPEGKWRPFGALEIYSDRPGLELSIDGRSIGATLLGATRVADVAIGTRTVAVRDARGVEHSGIAEVRASSVSIVDLRVAAAPRVGRTIALWSGAGVAVVGAVITGVAISSAHGRPEAICFRGSPDCPGDPSMFTTTGASYEGGLVAPHNPRGVLFAPLGLSLIAAGGVSSLAIALFDGEDHVPWIEVLAGVAAGVATYGLCAALD